MALSARRTQLWMARVRIGEMRNTRFPEDIAVELLCSTDHVGVACQKKNEFAWTFLVRSSKEDWRPRADITVTSGDVELPGDIRVVERTDSNSAVWFSLENSQVVNDLDDASAIIITGTMGKDGWACSEHLIAAEDLYGRYFADMVFVASSGEETKLHREILSHALTASPERVVRWTPPWAKSARNADGLVMMKFPIPHDVIETYVEILYKGLTLARLRALDLVKLIQLADELEDEYLIGGMVRLVQAELLSTWREQLLALTEHGAQTEALKVLRRLCVDAETDRLKDRLNTMQRSLNVGVPYDMVSRFHKELDEFEQRGAQKKPRTE